MTALLMIAIFFGSVGVSLRLVMERIYRRAKEVRVSPMPAFAIALGGYMVGTMAMIFAVAALLEKLFRDAGLNEWVIFVVVVLSRSFGAAAGAGAGYVYLWSRTTDDPDYEPLDGSGSA